jgi:hypothetical protein
MLALRISPDRHNNFQLQSQLYVTRMGCGIYSDLHNFTQRQFGLTDHGIAQQKTLPLHAIFLLTNGKVKRKMNKTIILRLLRFCCLYSLPIIIGSCKYVTNDDFVSDYKIYLKEPADTSSNIISEVAKMSDWTLALKENNNFHLYGTGINKVGYWRIENDGGKDYDLLLQSDEIAHARIDKKGIYFNTPTGILDSMFNKVAFVRVKSQ